MANQHLRPASNEYHHLFSEEGLNSLNDIQRSICLLAGLLDAKDNMQGESTVSAAEMSSIMVLLDEKLLGVIKHISPWLKPVSFEMVHAVFGGENREERV